MLACFSIPIRGFFQVMDVLALVMREKPRRLVLKKPKKTKEETLEIVGNRGGLGTG